jgi:hypothetical protein
MKHTILILLSLLLFCLSACTSSNNQRSSTASSPATSEQATETPPATPATTSMLSFSTDGAMRGTFVLYAHNTISMLRHGHKEFTIDIVDGSKMVFLVFYGYHGPSAYLLSNPINGGEVHISFGSAQTTWDLTATPGATCELTVTSDRPSQDAGIDSMQGSFTCPRLAPVVSRQHIASLSSIRGYFNIAILVQS